MERLPGGRRHIYKNDDQIIRPSNEWTHHVHQFLNFLHANQMTNVPFPLMFNNNEERLSFVDGDVYHDPLPEFFFADDMIISAAELLKDFHHLGSQYIHHLTGSEHWMLEITAPIETMCHGDFAPYNVTVINKRASGIIDFDTLHPGSRLEDLCYAVYRFIPVSHGLLSLDDLMHRIKLFLTTYGATTEEENNLFPAMIQRLQQLMNYMKHHAERGEENFIQNIQEGHLALYEQDINFIRSIINKSL